MDLLFQELRYGARTLLRTPAASVAALVTLALGIGANTAIYSVVQAIVLRPLPFPEASRLVFLREDAPRMEGMSVAVPNYYDWRKQATAFSFFAALRRSYPRRRDSTREKS